MPDTVKRTKFAVVGFTRHRELAPFGQPEWDVYGMNALHKDMPLDRWPFTGWFQVHSRALAERNHPEHLEWLKQVRGIPIYVIDKSEWLDVPSAVQLPIKEIEALNPRLGKYHTSSVSWMVGMAIVRGYEEIHVYGIDMASDAEYRFQRPACEAWLAFAEGLGITTHVPVESDLFSCAAQYGRGDLMEFRAKLHHKVDAYMERINGINANLAQIRQQKRNVDEDFIKKERILLKDLHHFEGQIIQCNDLLQNYTVPEGGGGSPYGFEQQGENLIVRENPDGGQPVNRIQAVEANG